jgi:hypothetical protein
MPAKKSKKLWYAFFIFTFLCFLWPLVKIGNRIEPFIFGLPFLFFWFVALIVVQFIAMVIMYWSTERD